MHKWLLWVFITTFAAQAAELAPGLTPVGAERAGSKDGRIPEWTGGATSPPGYKPGDFHPDPYSDDRPLYVIDAQNMAEHAAELTEGHRALLTRYPTYRMTVYPTRRSAAFSPRIIEMTAKNRHSARLVGDGAGVTGAAEGFPFPILDADPRIAARQAIWNHKLKFKGVSTARQENLVTPTPSGAFVPVRLREEILGNYWREGFVVGDDAVLTYFLQIVQAPARLAGDALLVHETLNQEKNPRQAWIYNPGQRRVRKAPNVGYDNPGAGTDGLRSYDMTDMFNGALDRYDWTYAGKRELLMPYNAYRMHRKGTTFEEFVRPGHLNTDLLRYERHRVHVVTADLKKGARHQASKRVFYLDEDSWQILAIEHYDTGGKLWRVSEAHCISYYEVPVFWSTVEVHHDLKSGRYIASGLDNLEHPIDFNFRNSADNFSPQALRQRGTR
jgi:hypothetical protein